jgi:hypothetical protein
MMSPHADSTAHHRIEVNPAATRSDAHNAYEGGATLVDNDLAVHYDN